MTRKARKALPLLTLVVAGCLCLATQASAYVYWGNLGSGTIARANLDGSGVDQSFIGGAGALNGVAVDAQHLYWAGAGSGTIGRADLDGQNVDQDFISIPSYLAAVAVDGSHIYWASSSANALGRANLDGSGIDPSFITADTPQGVAVDSGHVYWTNPPDGTIGRANLDGSGVDQSFIGGLDSPLAVAVDSQHVYWTAGNGTIGRANLDGSGVDQGFIGGSDALTGVAVDASHIYWTSANSETDTIGRANLDGSGVDQSFIGGADVPFGVAVDARSATSLTTSASPGTTFGGSVHDTATLAEGQAPSGTIEFSAYGPNDSDCSNPPAFTSTVNVNAGNGSYPSADFIPAAAGAYRWTASYSGDAINDASATACNDAGESVTVAKADQTITFAQPAGRTFGDPDFDPGATASSGLAVTYSSQTEAVCTIVAGKLHLLAAGECKATAEQPGDADYNGAPDVPRAFEVAKATPTLSTAASADVALGAGSLSDTATLAGGQGTPGGSVTFKLYGPDDAGCSRSPAFTDTKTVAGNGSYDSADFEPTEAGVYRWTASYGGDSNNDPVSSACNAANESVTVSQTPDHIAYVANSSSGTVTPIDTATDSAGTAIAVGSAPVGIAISPDGATAYVTDQGSNSVTPIDTATDSAGTAIAVGSDPVGIAITPDGATAYVTDAGSGTVTPIDTATDTAGTAIAVGGGPEAIAISPDGATAYVADQNSDSVTPIETATDSAGTAITVGTQPAAVAITPDGATTYVTDRGSSSVTPIDTATDTARTPIAVGTGPFGIAITPDQAPTAAFTATPAPAGSQTGFDASASSASPGQTLASYHWDFGDGSTQTTSSATTTHAYATAGNHTATLTVTDDAGCSTEQTFTGQTLSCNGSAAAQTSHQVTIAAASPALSTDASADVSLGGPVHDTATLSGGAAPGGQITFRLYGPGDAGCSGSPAFTDTKTVSGNGGYDSSNFTPTQPGTYRWTADYGGDADNDPVAGACNDAGESVTVAKADQTITFAQPAGRTFGDPDFDPGATASSGLAVTYSSQTEAVCTIVAGKLHLLAAGECKVTAEQPGDADYEAATPVQRSFQVAKATPTLVTAASPGIVLGAGSLGDTATLAGGQGTPTGTITFKLYGPGDAGCTGGAISTSTKPVSGNGPYSSDPFTPTAAGTYQWSAEYSGDSDNDGAGGDCGAAGESTVVAKATPTISGQASAGITIGGSVHDTATLAGGFDPTGTIVFKLYGPGDMNCSNAPAFTDTQNVDSGNGDYPSVDFSPTAAGDYRWTASYPGDAGNEPVAGTCADPGAAVTVAKAATTTALAASPNPALRATPSSLRLTATLDGGAGPSGQVSFLDGTTPIGSAPLEGGKAILTPTGLAAGSHQITARYEGDANNQPSASAPLTVVIEGPAPKVTVTYSPNHPHSPNPKGGPRYAFRFADEAPGVTFYCRLDKAPFKPCHSPRVYRHLKRGHHVFKIKSVDAAGRESAVRTVKFFAGRRR